MACRTEPVARNSSVLKNAWLIEWYSTGKLKYKLDVVEGLENAPKALRRLFDGSNTGKLLVVWHADHPFVVGR